MNLTTLTPKQTGIWISNLNKLIALRGAVKKYHNSEYERTEKLFNEKYGRLYKIWHGVSNFSDLYLMWDGTYCVPMSIIGSRVTKLGTVPHKMVEYKRVLRHEYKNTRDKILDRLHQKWTRYATQPFNIQECDLTMYQNLYEWHKELKEILVEGGVYDEAFDLDEDC